jgi:hypothetical protein
MRCGDKRRPDAEEAGAGERTDADCCRPAVLRTWQQMNQCGQPDRYCLEAAMTVYRWHHPESSESQAAEQVTAWIGPGMLH